VTETQAASRPQRGDELELRVESLAFGGEGVARLSDHGYVVFVAGAVPGDLVRAVVHKSKRAYAHARATEILEPSAERIEPRADHPGVPWQVLPYARQLEIKQAQVDEALQRLGGLSGYQLEPIVPALEQWRYRNKLEYSFGQSGGELVCGFHAPAGGRAVVSIADCLLASELGNRARELVLAWARGQGLEAWERDGGGEDRELRAGAAADGRVRLRNLVVREGRRTGRLQLRLVTSPGQLDADDLAATLNAELGEALSGLLWTRTERLAETTQGGVTELVWGDEDLPEQLGELDLRISAEAFFQTNTEMAEVLYGIAAERAALGGFERVFDLYSGIGTIAMWLAARAGEVWGIEIVEPAVADAIASARRNQVRNVHFFAGDARLALPQLVQEAGRPDVVVLDPPRAGLSKKVVQRVIDAAPRRIVYVSCNPTTLAPNAAEFAASGYRLVSVTPVDMFPQTHHIECVALLERDSG